MDSEHITKRIYSRDQLVRWMKEEVKYAEKKFEGQRETHDEEMQVSGIADDGFWFNQIFQYVGRARILGLENPSGRQAMAKCLMTLRGFCESMIRVYGDLPEPGHPSGEIHTWVDASNEIT